MPATFTHTHSVTVSNPDADSAPHTESVTHTHAFPYAHAHASGDLSLVACEDEHAAASEERYFLGYGWVGIRGSGQVVRQDAGRRQE